MEIESSFMEPKVSSMSSRVALAAALLMLAAAGQAARAQSGPVPLPAVNAPGSGPASFSPAQIMQLVAPIALYPDPVLADVLAAATYPAQVVEAERFAADPANAGLQGTALAGAASPHGWDQSVQGLLAFPQLLQMMDARLEWTEQLGRAFIGQQTDVMNAIQTLRRQAEAAGTLRSGSQESVVNDAGDVAIYPPSQQTVYLPAYDPACVYGPDPACTPGQDYVGWDDGVFLPYGFWQWGVLDWPGRLIRLHRGGGGFRGEGFGAEASGTIWHHPAAGLFATGGGARSEHFNYAPPANQLAARPAYAVRNAPAPALRGTVARVQSAAVSRPVSVRGR